jgi:hypothetical protein
VPHVRDVNFAALAILLACRSIVFFHNLSRRVSSLMSTSKSETQYTLSGLCLSCLVAPALADRSVR